MANAQTLMLFVLISLSAPAWALNEEAVGATAEAAPSISSNFSNWRAVVSRAGFLGRYAGGVGYEFNSRHAMEALIGVYKIEDRNHYQSNLIYRYSRWNLHFGDKQWRPFQMGLFVMRAWDQQLYFLNSPDHYPYENYYDGTALRGGFEFGTNVQWNEQRLALGYHFRILDTGLVAIYNNARRDLQYYVSSGLSLQYVF